MLFCHKRRTKQLDRAKFLLVLCESNEQYMKSVNDYYREHGTVRGYPRMTPETEKIIDDGIENGEFPDGVPFSEYDVVQEYYEIQRLKQKIEKLEKETLPQ